MNINSTYQPIALLYQYRFIISLCFLLILIAKPILYNSIIIDDIKYELFDVSENEMNSGEETISENEIELLYNYFYKDVSFHEELKKQSICFEIQPSFLNYNQDIKLPPPRV